MKATTFAFAALGMLLPLAIAAEKPTPPAGICCREPLPPAKRSDKSLYQIDHVFTSDLGKPVKLEILRGRPVVIAMFFTRCEHSCPPLLKEIKEIEKALSKSARDRTDFVMVSIDPKHDTVDALKAYREKNQLRPERWLLLRGEQPAVDALAEHLGFRYVPASEFQFGHSVLISILNAEGEIVFQQAGFSTDRDEAVETIEKLRSGTRRSKPGKQ